MPKIVKSPGKATAMAFIPIVVHFITLLHVRCMTWVRICVRSKNAQKQLTLTSLSGFVNWLFVGVDHYKQNTEHLSIYGES